MDKIYYVIAKDDHKPIVISTAWRNLELCVRFLTSFRNDSVGGNVSVGAE